MEKIITQGKSFIDESGRERIFYGVNICDKGAFDPETKTRKYIHGYNESIFRGLAERGVNIIRLGTTWDAIEHEPGVYDDEYIDSLRASLDMCEKYGIYAYLDMHQDLYSGFGVGAGDGAPAWACLIDNCKIPKKTRFVWAEGYFWGKYVHRAFDSFWTNRQHKGKGLLDYYADMWQHLAEKLGDHPALFGFDMLNEPFPGKDGGKVFRKLIGGVVRVVLTDRRLKRCKFIKDAVSGNTKAAFDSVGGDVLKTIAASGTKLIRKFDDERYTPFLNKTATAIRDVTDNGIMFIDNCYYSNLAIPCNAGPITVNGKQEQKACFSPHGYDFMVDTPQYKYASSSRTDAIFNEHANTQQRLNVPVIVGEWGGFSEGKDWYPHIHHLLKFFDNHKWSSTYWAFGEWMFNDPFMAELCRPFPIAVTGEIEAYRHDRQNNTFTLTYRQGRDYSTPTLVYLPKAPTAVTCTGEYKINMNESGSCTLEMLTGVGEHSLRVEL